MRYEVTFIGGPVGGTTQIMPSCEPTILMPVMRRINPFIQTEYYSHFPSAGSGGYDAEVYSSEPWTRRQVAYDLTTINYRWRNPAEVLRMENARLKAEVARNKELVGALDTLKKHLR